MSHPSPTITRFLFTQCYTVPRSTHSLGNFAFPLAVLIEDTEHTETSCKSWVALSVPLPGFKPWKAWCCLASLTSQLGRSRAGSAGEPSRELERSCGSLRGAENNPFCSSWQTAPGWTEATEQTGRTISLFLLRRAKCKNLHGSPDFSYFLLCKFFFSFAYWSITASVNVSSQ